MSREKRGSFLASSLLSEDFGKKALVRLTADYEGCSCAQIWEVGH